MKPNTSRRQFITTVATASAALAAVPTVALAQSKAPLKVAYSDWPGWTLLEVAKQKNWFKEAGVDVELAWFDYLPSIDAFSAGKVDGITIAASDALVAGASGAKSKIIMAIDYSDGNDKIIGKPGINSIKDLKGKKVGIEVNLVDHLLLLKALELNGLKQSDVQLVNTGTNETPQTLASGQVAAIGAWYPISGQALKQVAGSKTLFSSADAKGLIYDVLAVSPVSYSQRKSDWDKFVKVYYKCIDYILDPKTREDAVKIMAAKVGAKPEEFSENVPGTHFLTLAEAKKVLKKGKGLDSLYGSMAISNTFNLENKVYKDSQKPDSYIVSALTDSM
ncbi:MAG: NlpA lipoprotein [Verrucomicrobiales bacterium]|jgi:NitT/TauT family transport system substrate-binding protein|nr:NlpA lipoprotein [Verrucomicrobiales bacterium]